MSVQVELRHDATWGFDITTSATRMFVNDILIDALEIRSVRAPLELPGAPFSMGARYRVQLTVSVPDAIALRLAGALL